MPQYGTVTVQVGNANRMSYQQAKIGQSTIVNQTAVPVLPIPSATVVLPATVSGTIGDLRLSSSSSAPSGMRMYRQIAPKPALTSTTNTTIHSLMATSSLITSVPTMVTPSVSISPTVQLPTADRSLSSGSVPIAGSLVVQPPPVSSISITPQLSAQQQQQQQQTKLLLNAGRSAAPPTAAAVRAVVSGNVPPLYVPPNKGTIAAGGTVIKPTVTSVTAAVHSKAELDASRMRLTAAGGAAPDSSVAAHRQLPVDTLKPQAGGNAVEQQELRKPIKAFPIPVLSPFTVPKVVQHQEQLLPEQTVAPAEVYAAGRLVMMPNSAPIVVAQTSNFHGSLSLQLENQPADAMVLEDELSNDEGDQLVMDLGESNTHELEDHDKDTSVSYESADGLTNDTAILRDAQQQDGQVAQEIVYFDESNPDDGSNAATIEIPETAPSSQLEVPRTPEKSSPDLAAATTTNISPRLQKRSSSEHQRAAEVVHPYQSHPTTSGGTIGRRRYSEFATARQPPAVIRIQFTREHYNIPLRPHGNSLESNKLSLTPIDAPVNAPPAATPMQPDAALLPPVPLHDVMLLCNEKLELPKRLDEVRKCRPSGAAQKKHAKQQQQPPVPVHGELEAHGSEMIEPELIALDEVVHKRQRLGEEHTAERSSNFINSRSTSTSSDSNMAVGKAGRSNPPTAEPLPSRKGGSKSRATGGKLPRSQGAQAITPSESSLSLQDEGGAMHDTSTVADHLRWWDGVGYMNESTLRFEFNKFGMVQPLSAAEYERHCATDVYKDLQQPIELRQSQQQQQHAQTAVNRARTTTLKDAGDSYKCEVCHKQGRAADFVTPELCSIKCLGSNNNTALRKYILHSTHALQQAAGSWEGNVKPAANRPSPGSLDGAKHSKEDGKATAGKKKQPAKKPATKKATPPSSVPTSPSSASDDDSMSSLSLNSSTFLKRQTLRDFLPNSLDEENNNPAPAAAAAPPAAATTPTIDESEETEFQWQLYLKQVMADPAPVHLFGPKAFPPAENRFRVGMKLEAIDPENCSLFCVCTVVEVRGYRIKLHFDGYAAEYDFWVNASSIDIFPPGWCQQTNRALQPPASYVGGKPFHWKQYLQETNAPVPEQEWFAHLNQLQSDRNKFEIGMALEADDLKKSGKVCVATVADKMGDRILVHFDGWDDRYDYWVSIYSNYIHPVNWHKENNDTITAPPDWNKPFDWTRYIRFKSRAGSGSSTVPAEKALFKTRPPVAFKLGHRLEVVDRKQKKLIRPATVVAIDGYELKLCFDGWPRSYSFWIEDDSPDLHPINWCARTKHPLEPPPGYVFKTGSFEGTCEFKYCFGRGNAKVANKKFHDRLVECPYRRKTWMSEDRKPLRLSHDQVQSFVKMEHAVEVKLSELKKATSNSSSSSNKLDVKAVGGGLASLRKSISSVSGAPKDQPKQSATQRRASVSNTMASVPAKRIKRETADRPPSTATSTATPTPPPSRDPSKERISTKSSPQASQPTRPTTTTTTNPAVTANSNNAAAAVSASIRLALPVIDEYGPQLLHAFDKWREHSRYLDECTEQTGVLRKNPLHWTTDEISCYVERLPGCEQYAKKIRQEELTGRSFLSLSQSDLIDYLGVKIGPAIKMYNRIIRLRQLVTTKFLQL
uniref:SAM domain-containing protein n=1 Tax=Anopheles coluzzii TaxID=1518534 RepID=A0A8W7PH29_ANOCL